MVLLFGTLGYTVWVYGLLTFLSLFNWKKASLAKDKILWRGRRRRARSGDFFFPDSQSRNWSCIDQPLRRQGAQDRKASIAHLALPSGSAPTPGSIRKGKCTGPRASACSCIPPSTYTCWLPSSSPSWVQTLINLGVKKMGTWKPSRIKVHVEYDTRVKFRIIICRIPQRKPRRRNWASDNSIIERKISGSDPSDENRQLFLCFRLSWDE